jgi:hypothetical protein
MTDDGTALHLFLFYFLFSPTFDFRVELAGFGSFWQCVVLLFFLLSFLQSHSGCKGAGHISFPLSDDIAAPHSSQLWQFRGATSHRVGLVT